MQMPRRTGTSPRPGRAIRSPRSGLRSIKGRKDSRPDPYAQHFSIGFADRLEDRSGQLLECLVTNDLTHYTSAQRKSESNLRCAEAILAHSCRLWVKSDHFGALARCPLYPRKRTWGGQDAMSALCHYRPKCSAAKKQRNVYSITLSARASSV